LNDIGTLLTKKKKIFFKLDHSLKKTVNFNYIQILKGYTIKELISKINPSPKYKKNISTNEKNINELNLEKLNEYDCFNIFINFSFLEAFNCYYNQKKPLKTIVLGDKEIILSETTKSFSYLLKKNKKYEKEIIEAAEKVYLSEFDSSNISLDLEKKFIKSFKKPDKKNLFKTILYD
jgi:hypothetical protein